MALLRMCAYVDDPVMDEIDTLQAEIMKTLAHPRRLQIIHRLARGPLEVSGIAADLAISQPNASQHLAVMRAAGVVEAERSGREVRYRLSDPEIVAACGLMRGVLTRRLERFAGLSEGARLGEPAFPVPGAPARPAAAASPDPNRPLAIAAATTR
jgi:ArsR family transcriptional regulator